jgi:hypothetical protein
VGKTHLVDGKQASFGLLLADRDGQDLSILMLSLSIFVVTFAPAVYFVQRRATSLAEKAGVILICLVLLTIYIWEIVIIAQRSRSTGALATTAITATAPTTNHNKECNDKKDCQ